MLQNVGFGNSVSQQHTVAQNGVRFLSLFDNKLHF